MTDVNRQVADTNDDAQQVYPFADSDTKVTPPVTGFLKIARGGDEATLCASGFRFTNITIEGGLTITAATLELYFHVLFDDIATYIAGDDVDDSQNFVDVPKVQTRPWTTLVHWEGTGFAAGWETSPDISAIIQEIIDRPGWASGNDMSILCLAGLGADCIALVRDYGTYPATAAKLNITYEPPSAGGRSWGMIF